MNNNFSGTRKSIDKYIVSEPTIPVISSSNSSLFQIFFLSQDWSQSVEVVETNEIDFLEITQRLKHGESIFIKNKDQEPFTTDLKAT